ncbi:GNAT family N-acetyltransferase [Rhodohalobacter mucosus]|uniref:GNAT family N-acetyltransferase n=1 Tax=Rhodohalobacter mucosus TaxID=2079485 RepID=A0A316TMQ6_9BACT|nr:GNAT family N-acetyltransferase [Rhodohalobacter mucosus]PWN05068.1 GNAT family N-acetyltransferase [Rhodohalobacter mucosus]
MSLSIKTISGKEIEPYLEDLAHLRIGVFREFPYLYDGSMQYEEAYLRTYTESGDSVAVLVFEKDTLVGASTGVPMSDESEEFRRPFEQNGYNTNAIFYCAESVLKKEYRGRGLYHTFFSERERHAQKLNQFKLISFCTVLRPADHPLRPENYTPLDTVWRKFGYQERSELRTEYSWKDVDEDSESVKKMVFWMKRI